METLCYWIKSGNYTVQNYEILRTRLTQVYTVKKHWNKVLLSQPQYEIRKYWKTSLNQVLT